MQAGHLTALQAELTPAREFLFCSIAEPNEEDCRACSRSEGSSCKSNCGVNCGEKCLVLLCCPPFRPLHPPATFCPVARQPGGRSCEVDLRQLC